MKQKLVMLVVAIALVRAPVLLWAQYEGSQVLAALQKHLKQRVIHPEKGKEPVFKIVEKDAAHGHFALVMLECNPVEIKKKLTMETLRIYAEDMVIDTDKLMKTDDLVVKSSRYLSLSASITADQFTSFLARGKHTKNMNIKVQYVNEKLHINGNWKLAFFSGPLTTVGRLVVAKKDEIHFKVDSLKLSGISAPRSIINKFEKSLNPLVESKDLPLSPPIDTVKFKGEALVIAGERRN
ncbi:MAG: hypothetical protein NZT92_20970 [Abditibacteriales bacterium]|nr:hypothetical protein [Abditibacteriales bacterium]MDW8368196.1 hypothetical protein [Abditibacteriales bacterium]